MKKGCLLLYLTLFFVKGQSQTLPSGFAQQVYASNFNSLMGFTFDNSGRLFCWEKEGKVYVINNGVRTTLLDINQEVYNVTDLGLIGLVLDPNFLSNGLFYIYYIVDPKHLLNIGSQYDDAGNGGTMARVTRYQADAATGFTTIVANTRTILIGETASTGIPCTSFFHMGGSMKFAKDGTLFISVGDAATAANNDIGGFDYGSRTVSRGIMTAAENIGSYRSQNLDSHCGKILRINATNGNGISSNPYYSGDSPRSPRSRIWASGLRNPYGILPIPETGSHNPDEGNPGSLLIGDVGSILFEEVNLATSPGQNFGWPRYEGENTRAEHPSATWDPGSNKKKPQLYYNSTTGYSIVGSTTYTVGGIQVPGEISGHCILIGDFYKRTDLSSQYLNKLYIADYSQKWIKMVNLDMTNQVTAVENFASNLSNNVISLSVSPTTSGIFYCTANEILRIFPTTNSAPIAKIEADNTHGAGPLVVRFSAAKSYDPDSTSLTYLWQFGDGSPTESGLKPHHRFVSNSSAPQKYTVKVTVTDANGASASDSLYIFLNNTPPVIAATSLDAIASFPLNQNYPITLNATVQDNEQSPASLSLNWKIYLAHNDHQHLSSSYSGNNINTTLAPLDCELGAASYWYRVYLTVSDSLGLTTTLIKDLFPQCGGIAQTITFPTINDKQTTNTPFVLGATTSSGLSPSYYSISGPAYVIGNQVTLSGIPGTVVLRATQHGNGTHNQAAPVERSFQVNRPLDSQSFAFSPISSKNVNAAPFTLSASASTDPPKFLVVSGPATVIGNTVTLTGTAGQVTIRAYASGTYSTDGVYFDRSFQVVYPCPSTQTVNSLAYNVYQAQTALTVTGATLVTPSNQSLLLRAGGSITIQPTAGTSFSTGTNSTFKMEIAGCP
ncbi:PKD domain-containing protein [Runella sp. CRIBMP]|uniref:PQQ-dependent sugar dehydrogenase n=1 Tax=Runella sp. CRIBMP TaxID=2683261 RepID=UPI0014132859|nr:PQQ-dependent sugar dehydrogenase [Runella sp. CRIBMP]NBB20785.1 PKD domain-containing protein [Runella sp. CRIBMP]